MHILIFYCFFLLFCRHIPKAKATAIADTPELKRIAENTKIQSNVKYHEDFEKAKGKFTQVSFHQSKKIQKPYQQITRNTRNSVTVVHYYACILRFTKICNISHWEIYS